MTVSQSDTAETLLELSGIEALLQVVARLRSPVDGCPWDLKQTHHSLRQYLLEEAYEAVEAISSLPESLGLSASLQEVSLANNHSRESIKAAEVAVKDELGDVLLQVALHSQLASERGTFDFDAVCRNLTEKLIRRHPHVFAKETTAIDSAEAVTRQWAEIKQAEQAAIGQEKANHASILNGINKGQPALSRALETSQRAVKVGFAWPDLDTLWACVMSEFDEFRAELPSVGTFDAKELTSDVQERLESEFGDILFASVNLARQFKIDPEVALTKATAKFTRRFQAMETLIAQKAASEGQEPEAAMATLDFKAWDKLWKVAKSQNLS
jgi:MazG family protein